MFAYFVTIQMCFFFFSSLLLFFEMVVKLSSLGFYSCRGWYLKYATNGIDKLFIIAVAAGSAHCALSRYQIAGVINDI